MSNKIETITNEQRAKMPEYVNKWITIGSNTDRLDPQRTKQIIDDFRGLIGQKVDAPLFILDNPLECWVALTLICNHGVSFDDVEEEMKGVLNGNPKKYEIETPRLPWQSGSFFVSTFSFYDYMFEVLGVKIDEELYRKYKIWEATSEIGCIYPIDDAESGLSFTIVSQKPTEIHLNENNVLHRDGGPALTYAGMDKNIYALNGVQVPEYLAVTPAEELDLEYYNTLTNADVKAEFVRKVGIERFLDKGKLIDTYKNYQGDEYQWWTKSEYQLWDMSFLFDSLDYAPFLYMKNATTAIFHLEGVSPQCRTLKDAIKERLGGRDMLIKAIA